MTTSLVRSTDHGRGASLTAMIAWAVCAWFLGGISASHAADPPFRYVRAKASDAARVDLIDRSVGRSACARRSDRPTHRRASLRASVSSDRSAQCDSRIV